MTARKLMDRLGWKPGMATRIRGLPDDLAETFAPALAAAGEPAVWHLVFAADTAALAGVAETDVPHYLRGQHLWVAYPKKSSRVKTDIDRDHGWDALRSLDLHAVAQVSVSPVWSALRFRYRDEIATFTRRF